MDAIRVSMWKSAVCAAVITVAWALAGPVPGARAQVCGDNFAEAPEACDGTDDSACPGKCLTDCTCAVCGDNVTAAEVETCDGTDDSACPGLCAPPSDPLECQCPVCGDGVLNQPGEVCEVGNDPACPFACTYGCTCATCGDNVAEAPAETCDGTDDAACPGQCFPPGGARACGCPITSYKCASKKETCVVKKLGYLLKCHMKAELTALGPADPVCLAKARAKFDGSLLIPPAPEKGCFEKLEFAAAGQCFTNDDTAAMESKVDAFVSAVVGLVDPSYPAPIIDKCSAGKKKCVSKLASDLLRCHAKYEGKNLPVDPLCVQKALTKFNGGLVPAKGCFAKLETKYTCMTTNDSATLQSATEALAEDVACDLDPYQPECSTCGNNDAESPPEDCDGTDDAACPGACTAACNCP
jgi:hypothetical protein